MSSGYEELSSYLKQSGTKSLNYFLHHYRDAIVTTTQADSRWRDLDDSWASNFINVARRLGKDLSGQ
ncbi:7374_t:CDS:1, partial [Diversispora eburnea]